MMLYRFLVSVFRIKSSLKGLLFLIIPTYTEFLA